MLNGERQNEKKAMPDRLAQIDISSNLKWDATFRALDVRGPIARASVRVAHSNPGYHMPGLQPENGRTESP